MALGNMVGSLTVGKKKYADAEVFEPLAKAYGLPRETEEEKADKARVMERALKDACSVPMEIMERCCEAILNENN